MKTVQRLSVFVFAVCASGLGWPAPPVTDDIANVEIVSDPELVPQVYYRTVDGMLHETTIANGQAMMIERELATTVAWSEQVSSDDAGSYIDHLAPSYVVNGTTTCCKFTCYGAILNFDFGAMDCVWAGVNCEYCAMRCIGGYTTCPVGTKIMQHF